MNQKTHKIKLYRMRTFTEVLNDTVEFLRANWRVCLKFSAYIVLPLCIVLGNALGSMFNSLSSVALIAGDNIDADTTEGLLWSYIFSYASSLLLGWAVLALVSALVMLYHSRPEGLDGLNFSTFKPVFIRMLRRGIVLSLVLLVIVALSVTVAVVPISMTGLFAFLTIPALIVFLFSLVLCTPVYMLEDIGIGAALLKGLRYGFKGWWRLLGTLIVIGMLVNIVSGFVSMPLIVLMYAKMLVPVIDNSADITFFSSFGYDLMVYISSILYGIGNAAATGVLLLSVVFHYGHMAEKLDSVSVESDIKDFEDLGNESDTGPSERYTPTSVLDSEPQTPQSEIDNFDKL